MSATNRNNIDQALTIALTILSWIVIISAIIGGAGLYSKYSTIEYIPIASGILMVFFSLFGVIGLCVSKLFNTKASTRDNEKLIITTTILSWLTIATIIIGSLALFFKFATINKNSFGLTEDLVIYGIIASGIVISFVSLIGTIGLGVSRLLDLRLLFNHGQGQSQANKSDIGADIVAWLNENKKMVIGGVVLLIASFVVYYAFIKQDPVRDAKKAVAEYLECSEKSFEDRVKVDKEFIASFSSYNFKVKPDAYLKINELQKSIYQADSIRSVKADSYYKELQNRYVNDKEKLRIFDSVFTVQKQQMLSKTSDANMMYPVIDSLISTIKEAEQSSAGTKNMTMTFEGYSEGDYVHLIFKDIATGEEHDFRFLEDNNLCGIPILLDDNESLYGYKSNPAYLNKTFDVVIKEKEVLDSEDGENLIKTTAWVITSLKLK